MELRALRYFVAVAEELHFGRAAARLHMTQPPLSRAIRQLETDLGAVLLHRSPAGVTLTPAGALLLDEARTLLGQADRARVRVAAAAGTATLTIGTLADSAEQAGARLAAAYRRRHPGVDIRIREADFTDPTTGLRAGLVDVALTRAPFDDTGISTHVLRSDPVGVVLRTDDPLADRDALRLSDLADRRWCLLPEDTDPIWRAYWNGTAPTGRTHDDPTGRDHDAPIGRDHDGPVGWDRDGPVGWDRDGPVVRTVHECIQAVLWSGTVGLTPLVHELPDGLTSVRLLDMPPSRLVVAWNSADSSPLIRSFTQIAAAGLR